MPRCHHCRREVDQHLATCPHCQAELPLDDASSWVSVVRVTNLAEAGFFADLLGNEEIETQVRQHDRVSAMDGASASDYYLQVPEANADRAGEVVRRVLSQDEAGVFQHRPELDEDESGLVVFKPLVLMILAGGLVYLVGKSTLDEPGDQSHHSTTLWQALGETDQPLVSPADAGRPGFRLQSDRQRKLVYLEEDQDGDGRYDRRRVFRHGRLVADERQVAP